MRDLTGLLSLRASDQPDGLAYAFVHDDLSLGESLTYRQLHERARALAGQITRMSARGDRVLLVYPPGLEFVCALWACLYAGVVAVPASVPQGLKVTASRLSLIAQDAGAHLALTTSRLRQAAESLPQCRWLETDALPNEPVPSSLRASCELAYLQYTSGSTSMPRGVMVTHANVLANVDAARNWTHVDDESRFLSWLPHFHDYGLVQGILMPVFAGRPAYLMSPLTFVRRPLRWLEALARLGITHTAAPNFAYAACTQALAAQSSWSSDLSRVRYAGCGAEPIHPVTVENFLAAFAPHGFARSAFSPAYGLAEATLGVAGKPHGTAPRYLSVSIDSLQQGIVRPATGDARTLVSCGMPIEGTEVSIVDPSSGHVVSADRVGEILVRSASVGRGYWDKADATHSTFEATARERPGLRYLRTGDLGFMHAGELFVTGRAKDLLIVRGRNYYPQDIEWTVERAHSSLRSGHVAAFSLEGPATEQLIVVQELRRDAPQENLEGVIQSIREAVAQEHDLTLHRVVLVRAGSIPRTTSGKVRRGHCKEMLLAGELEVIFASEPSEAAEPAGALSLSREQLSALPDRATRLDRLTQFVLECVRHLTKQHAVTGSASPIATGLDSLLAFRLLHDIEVATGIALPPVAILQAPSLHSLAEQILDRLEGGAPDEGSNSSDSAHAKRLPASALQKGVWVAAALAGPNAMYNLAHAVHIEGPLDTKALQRALQAIVDRHPGLRTSFQAQDGIPYQLLHPEAPLPLRLVDLSQPPQSSTLRTALEAMAREPFDLTLAPLLRAALFRLADTEHVLLLTVHHLVFDGWSQTVLARELQALYRDFAAGRPASLPAPPAGYPDFATWEDRWLDSPEAQAHLDYWRARLAGFQPSELPTDRARTAHTTLRGDVERFSVPPALLEQLKGLARSQNCTLFMVLLAAFQTLLLRYSGREDVSVGSPVAGRLRARFHDTIGFFSNTLVMRTDLGGNPTFRELLARTRRTVLEAYEHQEIPTDRLVPELGLTRDLQRNALYPVAFALQTLPGAELRLEGAKLRELPMHSGIAKCDVWLAMTESHGTLAGEIEYRTDLFDPATIQRLAEHFQLLLAGTANAPEQRLAELPLLSPAERHRILIEWNETRREYPLEKGMHELLAEQARKRPDAIAVVLESAELVNSELDARANRLAHQLIRVGVGRNVPVGVCLERSFELAVALLAVLKAGGAFMPLDPEYPVERLRWMLHDSAAPVILTQKSILGHLRRARGDGSATLVCVDEPEQLAEAPSTDPGVPCSPEQPAYLIYTSGSSGQPKGVLVPHRGLVNHICWIVQQLQLTSLDRVLQKTSISFDASLWEFFAPLLAGATIVLARPGEHRDMAHLVRTLRQQRISVLLMVPSALRVLLMEPGLDDCRSLRYLLSGGESLDRDLARAVYRRLPAVTLGNFYGPTEASDDATCFELRGPPSGSGTVPVGKPIANARCHILDARLQPVPVGAVGEIYIGGTGVASGYLNQPELTLQRFVEDPFHPGERLYRTGDLARYQPDGNIEVVGRADFQVKVRGVRVELGEIETVLNRIAGVRQSVVIARDERRTGKQLCAYITGEQLDVPAIYRVLRSQLPGHLVPAAIVPLPALPTLPNGKLDRSRLPAPGANAAERGSVPPRGQTQEALAAIWQDVLGLEQVGAEDNFFELGGHSLLATQVISRIRSTLHLDLPLRLLFESPTIAGLARQVTDERSRTHRVDEPPIERQTRERPLATSFSQRRMWFAQQIEPTGTAYNMPFATRLKGALNRQALIAAMQHIVDRHEGFRTTFALAEGEPVQVIAPPSPLSVEDIDLRSLPREEREPAAQRIFREHSMRPFDLASGPLYRFCIVRLEDDDHAVLLLAHHAIGDQWSATVVARELAVLYPAFCRGKPAPLEPLNIQYADFAVWQRRHLGGAALEAQVAYWREKLHRVPALELPTDKPRPRRRTSRGASIVQQIPPSTLAALKQMCAERGATPFMALLACFKVLLSRYASQTDIIVGCPVANRTRVATENLVGTLVNTLAMRTSLKGDPTFGELLARVRETALQAYAHQDLPFERLVEEVRSGRAGSASPLVQVLFNVLNAPLRRLELEGLEVDLFEFDSGSAQFDLALNVDTEFFGRVALSYSTDLFEPGTAFRILTHYLGLIEKTTANPDLPLSAYRLLTDAQWRQVVEEWNRMQKPYPELLRTDQLIEVQAQATPEAVAVSMGEKRLTYSALEARANQLAHYLRHQGIGPGARVGVCMERSPETLVALLAVQKAGGTYVPLDPALPKLRLQFMAEDAALALTLATSDLKEALAEVPGRKLHLDTLAPQIAKEPSDSLGHVGTPEDVAYVLYTSGSTGKPKGVEVTHRGVTNLLWSLRDQPGCTANDTFLSVTTLSFDISAVEIYLPLIVGGRTELVSRADATDPTRLIAAFARVRPTIMQATPVTWRMLVEAGWSGDARLKVITGGEPLSRELADRLLERCATLWNGYGPTETTVYSTMECVARGAETITIGRPIANTSLYILDASGQPVAVGIAGELYIGGHGVARGYLGRPELTQERFIANPFPHDSHPKLYRTGDLARFLPDGRVVHLGRVDMQIKIRGFRIEPGEVEAALAGHPGIAQVVVAAKPDPSGGQQLVAYLIPRSSPPPAVESLRTQSQEHLPAYMVPSHFVFLNAFPLTASHKVDIKALPDPTVAIRANPARSAGPVTPIEVQVAALWRQVLDNESIGIHDNFFELGGHSLKAVELFSYIHQVFGARLPLATLFEAPTIAQLAALLEDGRWRKSRSLLVAVQPKGKSIPFFAVPGVGGDVLVFAKLAKLLGTQQPFYGLQARGLRGHEKPFSTVAQAARHYITEIRSAQPQGPYYIVGTCTGGVYAYEVSQQLLAQGENVALVLLEVFHPTSYVRSNPAASWLWPMRFIGSRLKLYARALSDLPVSQWGGFLVSKARRAATMLFEKSTADEMPQDGTFASARLTSATLQAVAEYEPEPYPGSIFHVVAGKRPLQEGAPDTRQLWTQLALSPSETVSVPAGDSGQLFVSPHVEQVAAAMAAHARQLPSERYTPDDEVWADSASPPAVGR